MAYVESPQLWLDGRSEVVRQPPKKLVDAFRNRLKKVAGFRCVPEPIAMVNTKNADLYYLFFASHKPVAKNIVDSIFRKYRKRMLS